MSFIELFLIAVGLSMDAFAVSVCAGLAVEKAGVKQALTAGLYFGGFQAAMPLIGFMVARLFADRIISFDHWVAFALLCFIGGRMVAGSFKREDRPGGKKPDKTISLKPAQMLPLAVATSIDALAVGVSFAFLQVRIVPAVAFIGLTTLVLSMAGVKIGSIFGAKFKSKAEFAGGIILILIGLKILLEHIGAIPF